MLFTPEGIRSGELAKSLLGLLLAGWRRAVWRWTRRMATFHPAIFGRWPWRGGTKPKISKTILNDYECSSIC